MPSAELTTERQCKPDDPMARIDVCLPCAMKLEAAGWRPLTPSPTAPGEYNAWIHAHHLTPGMPVAGLARDHDFDAAVPGGVFGRVCCHLIDCDGSDLSMSTTNAAPLLGN